jgi:limonene-1,2-epoxide hydrolase
MTEPEAVVRRFFELLIGREAATAAELLADDVEWRNTGMPTVRGARRVGGLLRDMERRRISFSADLHHVAATGPVVLTERTDYLGFGSFAADFWVCGTFRVEGGRIELWDDHFSWGSFLAGVGKGVARAVSPRARFLPHGPISE